MAELCHLAEHIAHFSRARAGVDDIERVAVEIDAGIFLAHGGHRGNLEMVLNRATERAGRHAVTAGVEARTGDEQIDTRAV